MTYKGWRTCRKDRTRRSPDMLTFRVILILYSFYCIIVGEKIHVALSYTLDLCATTRELKNMDRTSEKERSCRAHFTTVFRWIAVVLPVLGRWIRNDASLSRGRKDKKRSRSIVTTRMNCGLILSHEVIDEIFSSSLVPEILPTLSFSSNKFIQI